MVEVWLEGGYDFLRDITAVVGAGEELSGPQLTKLVRSRRFRERSIGQTVLEVVLCLALRSSRSL